MSEPTIENGASATDPEKTVGNEDNGFPPQPSTLMRVILWLGRLILASGIAYIGWVCVVSFLDFDYSPECLCWTYLAIIGVMVGLFIDRWILHKINVHDARLVDRSEVDALFVAVDLIEPRLVKPEERPENFSKKVSSAQKEVVRLKKIGWKKWTEFQVLSLDQILIDFLGVEDLRARSQSELLIIEDYAEDSSYRYDMGQYYKWQERINKATEKIDDQDEDDIIVQDKIAEYLRSELRALLEHIADYHKSWAEGSIIIRDIIIFGAVAVPGAFIMGILPAIYPNSTYDLSIVNWGFLGVSGSLSAVLLHIYKTNRVEVGNTEGTNELWRTVLGSALGFIAGMIIYSVIAGGLLTGGAAVPTLKSQGLKDVGLAVLWAVFSGVTFEGVFDRLRKSMSANS